MLKSGLGFKAMVSFWEEAAHSRLPVSVHLMYTVQV
jgi:hypothetical protein